MRQCPQGPAGQDAQPHVCDGDKEEYATVHCEQADCVRQRNAIMAAAGSDARTRLLGGWLCVISGVLLLDRQPVGISGGGAGRRGGGELIVGRSQSALDCVACKMRVDTGLA